MVQSDFVFEQGESITVGTHGETEFVFAEGEPVLNRGASNFVFESGIGLGSRVGIIDNFERGDISPYTGSKSYFNVTSTAALEGSFGLEAIHDDGSPTQRIFSQSGLNAYPEAGDTFQYRFVIVAEDGFSEPYARFDFAVGPNNNNYYQVGVNDNNQQLRLTSTQSGTVAVTNFTPQIGKEYIMVVDWGRNGTFNIELQNASGSTINTISGTNTDFTSGGVGWTAYRADVYYDAAEIIG